MQFSPTFQALATALNEAAALEPVVKKDKRASTGKMSYKYANIEQVIDVFNEFYRPQGLIFIQGGVAGDWVGVVTRIIHIASGEWVETSMFSPIDRQGGPQGAGSATTYLRRYALLSLMGLATEDDDGAVATYGKPEKQKALLSPPVTPALGLHPQVAQLADMFKASGLTPQQFTAITGMPTIKEASAEEARKGLVLLQTYLMENPTNGN
jgi:hypothetical protein